MIGEVEYDYDFQFLSSNVDEYWKEKKKKKKTKEKKQSETRKLLFMLFKFIILLRNSREGVDLFICGICNRKKLLDEVIGFSCLM